jgi:hypothetical protein
MMTLKQSKAHAKAMTDLHGEPWLVFITPSKARINDGPISLYNQGRFMACAASEKADYEAGGCQFPTVAA